VTPGNNAAEQTQFSTSLKVLAGLIVLTVVAYWSKLAVMSERWLSDPQYSHGYLVPLFAIGLLWLRKDLLKPNAFQPNWWGLPVLLGGITLRWVGAEYYLEWLDFISLIPCLFGIFLLVGGQNALRWSWPAIGFLFFMIPLPYSLETALREPLRMLGTSASTYLMQILGLPVLAEGNVIVLDDVRIGVVEACSGLRMLMIFFALTTAVALLSDRVLWERLLILFSAVPIALISNTARITVTGVLYMTGQTKLADLVFHDLAGWLMMPLALGLLWVELQLLDNLFITDDEQPLGFELADLLGKKK
jgi:exosortase